MKKIAILGSSGSIGTSTLQVARHLKDQIQVVALAGNSNIDLLEKQAREFSPKLIAVYDESKAKELRNRLPHIEIESGLNGLNAVASFHEADFIVSAITGTMGLIPTIAAIQSGKTVGLANKEALVSGGALVMDLAKKHGVKILPIDSEHSAIFQCLEGEQKKAVHKIILTASGGPFRKYSSEQLLEVTLDQALRHPTWTMGPKVTIDSSTLMNKGFEIIEAHWLFDVSVDKIDVVIHPQSIIHSMVEFVDRSLIAQLGEPSMITPIQYALTYPERLPGLLKPFNITQHPTLEFSPPDMSKFRCLYLAYEAIKAGGTMACYMNAANEALVNLFLKKQITWHEIATKLESLMESYQTVPISSVEDILCAEQEARQAALSL